MKLNNLPVFFLTIFFCFGCIFAIAQHPNIGGYNVYYGHLHNHTGVSDGTGTPDQAYNFAKNTAGLDFFSLADHSELMDDTEWTTIKNAANSYNQDGVFTTFYGFEWSSITYGHVSVINTEDRCALSSPTSNFTGLLTWVNARNGIAFFNHPGWAWWAFQEFNKFTNSPSNKFVGMELWNDVDGFGKYYYNDGFYSNDGNKSYFDEALIRKWKIGAAGSDDNHESSWGTRTPWRVGVLATALNRTEIMNAFIARRFFSTLDKNLSLSLKVNGAEMGSTVTGGKLSIEINAKDEDLNESFTKVVLMKNGAVAETINLNPWVNNVTITRTLAGIDKDYFYVKVTEADGDEAISSPVFIQGTANQAPVVSISSPANGSTFYVDDQININATASDNDGSVAKVEFYQGATLLGEDTSSPYSYNWTGALAGNYSLTAKATDNLGAVTVSSPVAITIQPVVPPVSYTIDKRISDGSDDAEQYSKGTVVLIHPVLNIVYESKTTGNQIIGLRFKGLAVPKGATIAKAYIEFVADKASSGTASLIIHGEATDNAPTFLATSKNISSRKKTTSNVPWAPGTWSASGVYQSNDVKTIVQEIINRTGWASGNSMAFIITGTGTRTAESFEGTPSGMAPLLHVEYSITKSGIIADKSTVQPDENVELMQGILVYPNPVHEILTVRIDKDFEVERVLIYSVNGSPVKEMRINQNTEEIKIDCRNFVPGTYLLKLNSNKGNHSMQFIKQ